jgi:cellulose synthase/poly-beta-1,6-N-acetylglucosamine synthase-like glycosyltransferase
MFPQYGGTVGGFRKEILEKVGGWNPNMLTEDTDLTVRCILQGYQIRYVNDAEAYEEAVTTWRAYWGQRYRWAKGHMQCAIKHLGDVLKATHLSKYERTELTLLLCVYFLPVIVLLGWIVGVCAYLFEEKSLIPNLFLILSIFTYSAVGNFAPFFEIGAAAYLDNRKHLLWLLPCLMLAFVVMMLCCTKALIDLARGEKEPEWNHTLHNGNGYNGKNSRNGKNGKNGHGNNNLNGNGGRSMP